MFIPKSGVPITMMERNLLYSTVSDVCSTDWQKKDSANFESQNFEGP